MKIKDRPEFKSKGKPFILGPNDLVSTAIKTMSELNIGSVVILDADEKVLGIVTERDLLRRLLNEGRDPKRTRMSQIMTSQVKTANAEDQVIDWLRQMSNERFRHLPVVDSEGRLINMMSQGDFVSYTWPELLLNLREKTGETIRQAGTPVPILIGGIIIYSILMLVAIRFMR